MILFRERDSIKQLDTHDTPVKFAIMQCVICNKIML